MLGIENVNEFYTHHYLAAILGSDIKDQLAAWREAEGSQVPWRRLAQLQQPYFRHHERLPRLKG